MGEWCWRGGGGGRVGWGVIKGVGCSPSCRLLDFLAPLSKKHIARPPAKTPPPPTC